MNTRRLTLVLAGLAMIGPFAIDTYLPSFLSIARHYEVSALMMQQTLSVYLFTPAVMTLFYGTMSDTFGRRPVILGALALFIPAGVWHVVANPGTEPVTMVFVFPGPDYPPTERRPGTRPAGEHGAAE